MREKRLRVKAKAGRQMEVQFREGETSEVRHAGQRTLNGVAEEKNTSSDFHVTTQCCIPASQTALRAKLCFIHAKPSQKRDTNQGCSRCCSIIHQAQKCILIEVALNLGHHFSQLFFSFFFSQQCVMLRQTASHNPPSPLGL